jgi:chromosome partitioning protein
MKTIAILSQKGGAGKTTLALHLAVAAELTGKTCALIDLDPQASATGWKDSREKPSPAVVSAQAVRLPQVLKAADEAGAKLAIIDTAPLSENSALAAARVADFILIPCRPAILDLRAISLSIDITRLANKSASIILNCVPPRGSLAQEATNAIKVYDVSICPITIVQRVAYMHSLTLGQTAQEYEPNGKAADEIKQLYKWICKQVKI